MKKLLVTLAAVLVSVSTFAQGTIAFNTRIVGQVDAPVWAPGGTGTTGAGSLGTVNAQLFLVGGAPGARTYTALTPATTFFTGTTAANRYVVVPNSNVIVPTVGAGQQATIVLRAFNGASYEASQIYGQSGEITITLGGQPATGAPLQPAVLAGLQGFELVPEPSTLAFGLLGAAALLYRRRK